MRGVLNRLNVTKAVCDHLVGEGHTERHRMITGVFIVIVGVGISKIPTTITIIHFLLDAVGYGVHGLGCIPFIDRFIHLAKSNKPKEGEE